MLAVTPKVVNRIEAVVDTGEIQLQPVFRSEVARKTSEPTFEVRPHGI